MAFLKRARRNEHERSRILLLSHRGRVTPPSIIQGLLSVWRTISVRGENCIWREWRPATRLAKPIQQPGTCTGAGDAAVHTDKIRQHGFPHLLQVCTVQWVIVGEQPFLFFFFFDALLISIFLSIHKSSRTASRQRETFLVSAARIQTRKSLIE